MAKGNVRKVTLFFPVLSKDKDDKDKQMVRSYVVGQKVQDSTLSTIEELVDTLTNLQYFVIKVKDQKGHERIWKHYTPRISDIEIEYDILS